MKFTRLKTTVIAGVMAASMVLPGMTAFATDIKASDSLKITKIVKVGEGVTIPSDTISFTATQTTTTDASGATVAKDNADGTAQGQRVENAITVSFNAGTVTYSTNTAGDKYYLKDFSEVAAALKDAEDGEYTFTLVEADIKNAAGAVQSLDSEGYGWTKDTTTYYLHVYKNGSTFKYLVTTEDKLGDQSKKKTDGGDSNPGDGSFKYENTYTKKAGKDGGTDPDVPGDDGTGHGSLEISKTVNSKTQGGNGDTYSGTFTFKVTFTNSKTSKIGTAAGETAAFEYKVNGGNAQNMTVTANADGTYSGTITLENSQKAVFTNLPAGITVKVEETGRPNTESTSVKQMLNNATTYTQESGTDVTAASGVLGEKANIIKFTNTNKDVEEMGVVTTYAPYVTLVVVAFAAVAAYVVMKRRVAR